MVLPGCSGLGEKPRTRRERSVGAGHQLFLAASTIFTIPSRRGGKNRSCIGLACNETLDRESPHFRWIDEGLVIDSMPGPRQFQCHRSQRGVRSRRSRPWLSFGSFFSGIQMVQLNSENRQAERLAIPARRPKRRCHRSSVYHSTRSILLSVRFVRSMLQGRRQHVQDHGGSIRKDCWTLSRFHGPEASRWRRNARARGPWTIPRSGS